MTSAFAIGGSIRGFGGQAPSASGFNKQKAMAELTPYPFAGLVTAMFRGLEQDQAVFGLPSRRFFGGDPERDLAVSIHGSPAGSPLGPAAGPHTQMAQNIVLAWLAGARVLELKTVQVLDELEIPRPCIDMRTVGYNAEWSQELRIDQTLAEYVKGVMLIEMLRADDRLALTDGFQDVWFDMSLGYDLAGLENDRVRAFVDGLLDAGPVVDSLRKEIPSPYRTLRELDFPTHISGTVTLSTFHGCPPNEIAAMCEFLMRDLGLDCTIKFNPTLLGQGETGRLLNDVLHYEDIHVPESAFTRDTTWNQAVDIVGHLGTVARETGRRLGVKFSNTLIVENRAGFLPETAEEVYLSGPPLHVLAIQLVRKFRKQFGDTYPVSFSAGIDRANFPDAVALGLVPITVCTDLLKKGGYGRLFGYYKELARRMDEVEASSIEEFILHAYGVEPGVTTAEAKLYNTSCYADRVLEDPRYRKSQNSQLPKRVDRKLDLFDCITCDICIPVCPNAANFTFHPTTNEVPQVKARRREDRWIWEEEGTIALTRRHQIANYADFCNDCGNCDVFCPEEGEPYVIKPRFFGSEEAWRSSAPGDGFYMERRADGDLVLGRMGGIEYRLDVVEEQMTFTGPSIEATFSTNDPAGTLSVRGPDQVDLTPSMILDCLRRAVFDTPSINFVNTLHLMKKVRPR
jgi:putative selenate reductase